MPTVPATPREGAYVATISTPCLPGVMMSDDEPTENPAQAARRKLTAGAWLLPTEVGHLFGVSRWTVSRWMNNGAMIISGQSYPLRCRPRLLGSYREANPADVAAALAAFDEARRNA